MDQVLWNQGFVLDNQVGATVNIKEIFLVGGTLA
jgi:hypothetical protein